MYFFNRLYFLITFFFDFFQDSYRSLIIKVFKILCLLISWVDMIN